MKKLFTFIVALAATITAGAETIPYMGTATFAMPSTEPITFIAGGQWGGINLIGNLGTISSEDYPSAEIVLGDLDAPGASDSDQNFTITVKNTSNSTTKNVAKNKMDGNVTLTLDLTKDIGGNAMPDNLKTFNQILFRDRTSSVNKKATVLSFCLINKSGGRVYTTYTKEGNATLYVYSGLATLASGSNQVKLGDPTGITSTDYAIYSILLKSPVAHSNLQLTFDTTEGSGLPKWVTPLEGMNAIYFKSNNTTTRNVRIQTTGSTTATMDIKAIKMNINKVEVLIPSSGLMTFVYDLPLNLANLPDGLEAYYPTTNTGSAINVTKINQAVPKSTPILLRGTPGEIYAIDVVSEGTGLTGNKLKYSINVPWTSLADEYPKSITLAADANKYVLSGGQFHSLATNGATILANKAWLEVAAPTASARLGIVFEDGETTGVRSIENRQLTIDNVYNMSGQRVAQPTKGLYIVNGKKVIKK